MKDCEAIRVELPAYAGGKLDGDSAAPVQAHLESCADCRAELAELERLEALLCAALSPITPSVTFASRFANRLAAEVAEADEASPGRGWLGWLLRPWLIPSPRPRWRWRWCSGRGLRIIPRASFPCPPSAAARPARSLRRRSPLPISRSRRANPAPKAALAANPPSEVLQRPELFVDYAVIRDLDILESGKGDGESHAG